MKYTEIAGGVTAPEGFLASGIAAGIKKSGKRDMALIYSQESDTKVAGVFTSNQCAANCIQINREICQQGVAQGIIVTSGNANACTGKQGEQDNQEIINQTAQCLNIDVAKVLLASTGIVGEFLPMDKINNGINLVVNNLDIAGGADAAKAIMTTDTYPKKLALELEVSGKLVRIGGIAKGSGMIEPNMATMLSFITTDLAITTELLQEALTESVNHSFNRITVDGDQSTNDMVLVMANTQAENDLIAEKNEDYYKFLEALKYLSRYLAQQIVRDGEGATKFVEVEVKGAVFQQDALTVARKIANSNLVKTAIFGEDPNWGRIIVAIGATKAEVELNQIEIKINNIILLAQGQQVIDISDKVETLLKEKDIKVEVNLNLGQASDRVWTCDLSYEYVKINGEYHT